MTDGPEELLALRNANRELQARVATLEARLRGKEDAAEALQESDERYRGLFNNASLAIFQSTLKGEILAVNSAFARMFGFPSPEDVITTLSNAAETFADPKRREEIIRLRAEHPDLTIFENLYRRKDGSTFLGRLNIRQIFGSDNRPLYFEGFIEDITERQQAEEALRESEESYRQLFEAESDAIFLIDNQTGNIVQANQTASDLYGYRRDELLAMKNADLSAEPEQTQRVTQETPLAAERVVTIPLRWHRKKDGTRFPVEITGRFFVREGRGVHIAAIRDITARRQAEEALREQTRLSQVFLDSFPCVALLLRPKTREIVAMNRAAKESGCLLGGTCFETWAKFDKPCAWCLAPELWAEGSERHIEVDALGIAWDAHWIPVSDDLYLHYAFDITEHRRAEEALRQSEEELDTIIENLPCGVYVKDAAGRYRRANRVYEVMTGLRAAEILGKTVYDLAPKEAADQWAADDAYLLATGETQVLEQRMPPSLSARSGVEVFETRKALLRDAHGAVVGLVGVSVDLTARKRAEQALRESEGKLRAILDATPFPVAIVDAQDDKILFWSRSALTLFGHTAPTAAEWYQLAYPVPDYRQDVVERWKPFLETARESGRTVNTGEYRVTCSDGSVRICELYATFLAENLIVTFNDITARKQAEEELRESEARFHSLFDNTTIGVYRTNLDGRILLLNPAGMRTLGYDSFEEITERNLESAGFEPEYERRQFHEKMKQEGTIVGLESAWKRRDGTTVYLRESAAAVKDSRGNVIHYDGTFEDITERKQAEEALRESEAKYRLLADHMTDTVWLMDLNLKTTYTSPSVEKLRGYTLEELQQLPLDKHLTPTSLQLAMGVFAEEMPRLLADPTYSFVRTLELEFYRKDGTAFWSENTFSLIRDENGNPLSILGEGRDITERKQAEQALRESETRLRDIMFSMADWVWEVDEHGVYTYSSERGFEVLRASSADIIGKTPFDFMPPDEAKRVAAIFSEIVAQKAPIKDLENWNIGGNGARICLLSNGVPILDEKGNLKGYRGVDKNITEIKRAEEEREKLQAQLAQAQKMESVGRLAGGVAHDFNNMLGVILGHAEMALQQVDPALPLHDDLEQIQKAAQRSADLTRQLLAFARRQTVAPRVLDLNDVVANTLKMLQRLIGENIALVWQPGMELWPVRMDPAQLDQILANLCVNARDAITGVGRITIETENVTLDEAYCATHAGAVPGEYAMIAVSDDGCGMDQATQAHLFEPFFTTKPVGQGTGLGLATVYGAVKQNYGYIEVRSAVGQGTTFAIYLPRHIGPSAEALKEGAQEATRRGTETVLLVEDEPAILNMSRRMLEVSGYRVLAAGTPGEAMRLAAEHSGEIDLLMTDVIMPEMNGRDLAERLLALYPKLKRLFMSGYTADVIAPHGVMEEGVYFIQKPFTLAALTAKVREALGQAPRG